MIIIYFSASISILIIIYGVYFLIRNNQVYKFRQKILHQDINLYYLLPSYDEMLYSIKPLKIESYIDISDINK